ncbi:hypothetical protein V6Z11_A08G054200 [Gossypium hirsutum]
MNPVPSKLFSLVDFEILKLGFQFLLMFCILLLVFIFLFLIIFSFWIILVQRSQHIEGTFKYFLHLIYPFVGYEISIDMQQLEPGFFHNHLSQMSTTGSPNGIRAHINFIQLTMILS